MTESFDKVYRSTIGHRQNIPSFGIALDPLPTTYTDVGDFINVHQSKKIRFLLTVTNADATSIEFKGLYEGFGESTGFGVFDDTGSLIEVSISEADITAAGGLVSVSFDVEAAGRLKLQAKRTAGTDTTIELASFFVLEPRDGGRIG